MINKKTILKTGLKNTSYVIISQLIYFFLSIITSFLLPKFLGVSQYGYWQVYLFYIGYVGFFHLGFIDGVYLRYGQYDYQDLPIEKFRTSLRIFFVMIFIIAFIVNIGILYETNIDKRFALWGVDIGIIIVCLRTYFTYLLQFTNQIKKYSITTVLNRLIFAVAVILCFIFKLNNFKLIILLDLLSRFVIVLICSFWCKDIVFGKGVNLTEGFNEFSANIKVGINLMFANIMGMLVTGIGRFLVERYMSINIFSLYSLANSAISFALIFINAVALVLYPLLKRLEEKDIYTYFPKINIILCITAFTALLGYYPICLIIKYYLTSYIGILDYLYILFPIILANGKINIVINTYYKTLRKEKIMFLFNLVSIVIFCLIIIPTFFISKSIILLSLITLIILLLECYASEAYLKREMKIKCNWNILEEVSLIIIFLAVNSFGNLTFSFIIYSLSLLIYLYHHRKEFILILVNLKKNR